MLIIQCADIAISDRTWIAAVLSLPYLLGEDLVTIVRSDEVILYLFFYIVMPQATSPTASTSVITEMLH